MKTPMKILTIDDSQDTLAYLTTVLTKEGYEIHTALTGAEGLAKFSTVMPDLVLLDLNLPGENALDILSQMREQDSVIPIAMLTGYGYDDATVTGAKESGATDYILKTAPLSTMRYKIKKMLEKRSNEKVAHKESVSTILIIDDDEEICKVFANFLKANGYNVLYTTDPRKALEIVQQ